MIAAISQARANVEVAMPRSGRSPLLAAAGTQHLAVVQTLLELRANPHAVDIGNQNAANVGNHEIREYLWEHCRLEPNEDATKGKGRISILKYAYCCQSNQALCCGAQPGICSMNHCAYLQSWFPMLVFFF